MPVTLKLPDGQIVTYHAHTEPVRIDRHTTAKILGLTIRQLQRWHNAGFGPPRRNKPWEKQRPIWYDRAEVEQWAAQNGYPK